MRMLPKAILLPLICLSGCASVANYQASLQEWVGQPEQRLESSWGPPSSIVISGNTRYLTFARNDGVYVQGNYWGRTVTPLYCSTIFYVQAGVVVQAKFQGNECTSY